MTTFGGNSGYVGYSMSKRAAQARREGKFPKTDFKKEYGLSEKLFNVLCDADIICSYEWHHTSKYGSCTAFYEWVFDEYLDIWLEKSSEIKKLARGLKNRPRIDNYPATQEGMDKFTADCDEVYRFNQSIVNSIKDIFDY